MSPISMVTPLTRERIAREFDDRGPDACTAEVVADLRRNNPELLDMANKCASSLGRNPRIMTAFGMFYRLILAPAVPSDEQLMLSPLPRVTPQTREEIVRKIDHMGVEAFTMSIIEDLERDNPELLQMAHEFSSRQTDYLPAMQGFALLYHSLVEQGAVDRGNLH